MSKNAKVALVAVGLVILVGYFAYITMSAGEISCEACVEFRGATECRRATGKDREEAVTAAVSTACGLISGGVTDGIACRSTEPESVTCEQR